MKGMFFDDIHSYHDLGMVLSKVEIPPAPVKTNYVDVPGADGSLDLTEAPGRITYGDRAGCKFIFTILPPANFEDKKREISNLLNGRRRTLRLEKDPNYYWTGRCTVDEYASDKGLNKLVVGATLAPYKLKLHPTTVIVSPGEQVAAVLHNGRKTVVPTINNAAEATIEFNGGVYTVNAGTHRILNIELVEGVNNIMVTSTEPVEFIYQEGDL